MYLAIGALPLLGGLFVYVGVSLKEGSIATVARLDNS